MRIVDWSAFEVYKRCPLWSLNENSGKSESVGTKDTQHLVRGTVIQNLVDKWFLEAAWQKENFRELTQFTTRYAYAEAIRVIEEFQRKGRSKLTSVQIAEEAKAVIENSLPGFIRHVLQKNVVSVTVQQPLSGIIQLNSKAEPEICLTAVADLVVTYSDHKVLYEGKATRKPEYTKEDQVRWQHDLLKDPLTRSHFYVFYHTTNIKEVKVQDSPQQLEWEIEKKVLLERLVQGDYKAIPQRLSCVICPYEPTCNEAYKPKKRVPKGGPTEITSNSGEPKMEIW
jgi:hypothetical protein